MLGKTSKIQQKMYITCNSSIRSFNCSLFNVKKGVSIVFIKHLRFFTSHIYVLKGFFKAISGDMCESFQQVVLMLLPHSKKVKTTAVSKFTKKSGNIQTLYPC